MVVAVWVLAGVIVTVFSMQPFGVCYDNTTGFLSNIPGIWLVGDRKEHGVSTVPLVGKAIIDGVEYYKTRLAEPYPMGLGMRYGVISNSALEQRRLALRLGAPVPMADKKMDGWPVISISAAAQRDTETLRVSLQLWLEAGDIDAPFVPNGDGAARTFSVWEHMHWGAAMAHELETSWGADVPEDLQSALDFELMNGADGVDEFRQDMLKELVSEFMMLEEDRWQWNSRAAPENADMTVRHQLLRACWVLQAKWI